MIKVKRIDADNMNYNNENFDVMNAERFLEDFLNEIGADSLIQIMPIVKGRTDSSLFDPHGYTVVYHE